MINTDKFIKDVRGLISENNSDNSFFTDDNIIGAINRSLLIISTDIKLPRAILWNNITVGTQEFALPAEVMEVISVTCDKTPLEYITYDLFLKDHNSKEILSGKPSYYYLREHYDDSLKDSILAIGFDTKFDKEYMIEIEAVIETPRIEDITQNIPLPKSCELSLQNLVLAELYDKDNKHTIAGYYRNLYKDIIQSSKSELLNRVTTYVK